jgi:hypothetical protein
LKKLILPLLLVVSFIFAGFNKASAISVTVTTLGAPGTYGLNSSTTLYTSQTNIVIDGFSITGSGAGTLTALRFYNGPTIGYNNSYFTSMSLYSSTSSTFPGVGQPGATLVSTVTATASYYINFTGLSIPVNTTPVYYFLVISNIIQYTNNYEMDFYSATGATYTANAANTGYDYTIAAAGAVTVTSVTPGTGSGLNGPTIYTNQTNIPIDGFSLTSNSATTVTQLRFYNGPTTGYNNAYFTSMSLYSSTSSVFPGVGQPGAALVSTVTATASYYINFTGLSIPVSTTPVYYFLVISNIVQNSNNYEMDFYSYTTSGAAVTSGAGSTNTGYDYTIAAAPVTAVAASLTTTVGGAGLSAINPISTAGNYAVYGMSLTPSSTGTTKTITGLTFTTSGTPAQTDNYFYATAYLYTSTNASYTGATPTLISTINPVPASNTLAFTFTASQNITAGTTRYYYVVIVYSTGVAATANQTITYSSATSTATITPGATIAGPNYTYNVPTGVVAQNVPSADLTSTAIYVGQTNIAVAGIGLSYSTGTTTLTQLTFAFTPNTAATLAQYFSSSTLRIVSTTSTPGSPFNYASTTTLATAAAFTIGAGTITVTIPSATINSTTTYFYLVTDYTVTGGAVPKTFTFIPTGYTTALSGAVATTYTPTNSFTCTAPTYYWTGATNNNWTTGSNWEESTSPAVVTGYYPGQLGTTDNVVISPVQTTPTINLTANETIATLTNSAGVATTLNINSGITLTTGYFTIGATTGTSASSITLGGTGTLLTTSTTSSNINNSSTLTVPTGTILALGNAANIDTYLYLNGSTASPANLNVTGGTINAYDSEFNLAGNSSSITASSGIINATNDTYLILAATSAVVTNNGAAITFDNSFNIELDNASNSITNNSGTFSITDGSTVNEYAGGIYCAGGTLNLNDITAYIYGGLYCSAGTLNIIAATDIEDENVFTTTGGITNITGASGVDIYGTETNNGGTVNITTNSGIYAINGPYANTSGTTNVDASTFYLETGGSSLTNAGSMNFTGNSVINYDAAASLFTNTGAFRATNTTINFSANNCQLTNSAGTFTWGSGSVMNLTNSKSKVNNSGTGTFTCAPTSIINLTFSTGTLANAPTVNNTSSNPFTLLSDHTGSATIGKIATQPTSGAFTGKYNVQRYISTDSRNYRVLSSPTNVTQAPAGTAASPNLVDISQLGNSVTNPATYNGAFIGGPGANFSNHIANPLLYLYQESILPGSSENATFTSGKNVGVSNISVGSPYLESTLSTAAGGTNASDNATLSVKVPAGNAYLLYYIHDNTSTNTTDPLDTAVTTSIGYINQGTIPFVLWGTGTLTTAMTLTTGTGALYPGVTMVGNPYASTIDLQQLYKDNIVSGASVFTSGTGEAFYELDPSTEQFVSYNYAGTGAGTTSGSTASRYIASGQGFYVTVINNGKPMNFQEDQKTTSTTTPVFPSPILESVRTPSATLANNVSTGGFKATDAVLHTAMNATPVRNALLLTNHRSGVMTDNITDTTKGIKIVSDTVKDQTKDKTLIVRRIVDSRVYTYPKKDTTTTPTPPTSNLTGLHLKLVLDSLHFDECGIYFSKKYSDSLDKNDAPDLDGTGGKVFLSSYTSDKVRTSINAMSMFNATGKRIPLFVKYSASGLYSLGLEDIANFNKHYSVFLIDNMLKDSLDLTLYKSYNFNYTAGTAGDSTRFVLAIEHKPIPHYALVAFAGSKVTPGVQLSWTTLNEGNITTFILQKLSANNTYVYLDSLHSDSTGAYSYVDQHPTLGNNTYRLQQIDGLGNITYSAPVTIGYNSTNPNGGLVLYPNPAKTTMTVTLTTSSVAVQVATADIYNTSGKLIEHKVVNSNSFVHDVSGYALGAYIIELKNSNGVLVGNSKFVKVN